jgi:4-amino-4-deoxy-L-arabinose transferase-like glycosyltransferase
MGFLFFCGLLFLCFHLRSEMLWKSAVTNQLRADAREYFLYAHNLLNHGTYSRDDRSLSLENHSPVPDAVRSPGYPLFLSLFMWDSPSRTIVPRIQFVQVLLSSITVLLAFRVFKRFLANTWSAAAALLTALSPHLIVINTYLLTEALFTFLLVLSGYGANRLALRPSCRAAAALGMVLGAATLVRPSFQFFPFCAAAFFFITARKASGFRLAAAVLGGFFIIIAPWHARNLSTLGVFSDKTLSVGSMHHGIYPDFMYDGKEESYGFPYRHDPRSAEIGKDFGSVVKEIAARFEADPIGHAKWYFVIKPLALWSWDIVQGQGDIFVYPIPRTPYNDDPVFIRSRQAMRWMHEPLGWLCLLGCLTVWLPGMTARVSNAPLTVLRFISMMMAYFTVIHSIAGAFPRYSIPLRPFYYGMAMFGCSLVCDHLRSRYRGQVTLTAPKAQSAA